MGQTRELKELCVGDNNGTFLGRSCRAPGSCRAARVGARWMSPAGRWQCVVVEPSGG